MLALRLAGTAAALSALVLPSLPAAASPSPVSVQFKTQVAEGGRPALVLLAAQPVTDIRLELTRDDGEKFEVRHAALATGQRTSLLVGDGKSGKAHYTGTLLMLPASGHWWTYELSFDTVVHGSLTIKYDVDHLDLVGRVLQFQLSRPAGSASLTVIGEDGAEIGHGQASFERPPPDTWLALPWTQEGPGRVLMLKLRVTAADGLTAAVDLTPWSVDVEHEELNFDTDSAVIRPGEAGKLDASYLRIVDIARQAERFIKVKLYVGGHTDTVGSKEHNRQLSLDRARAIADHLRRKGLKLAIAYEGFGEEALRVLTPDGTDEPRNRRVDYVLQSADTPPPSTGAYRGVRASWKALR